MLTHYLVLGLPQDADDNAIRKRYLEMVATHTPEADPDRFREVTVAYDAIRDERRRIEAALFGTVNNVDYDRELCRLATARRPNLRRVGLCEMIRVVSPGPARTGRT